MKKLTSEEINLKLRDRPIRMIGEYLGSQIKTEFICDHGHKWHAFPNMVMSGRGCPYCAGNAPLTKEIVNERIYPRGLYLIGEYTGVSKKTLFECSHGHQWEAAPNDVMVGNGCPHCSGLSPLTKEIVNKRIYPRGLRLVSDYMGTKAKSLFECEHGHQWEATPNDVMNGNGCPFCAEYGFNPSKPGWIYILKYEDFIKYGITNNIDKRLSQHKKNGSYSIVLTQLHENGSMASDLERRIRKTFGGRFISRERFPNGYTETLCVSKLDQLITFIST